MNNPEDQVSTSKIISAVIIEDELHSQATLQKLLFQCCKEVRIQGTATTVNSGIPLIDKVKPDIIFLDIALPDGDGFNILENIVHKNYEVIFVTAYDKYAIRAFEFSAIHYLLKPVSQVELTSAISRFRNSGLKNRKQYQDKLEILKRNINQGVQKIMLPTAEGFEVIDLEEIIRLEASHNYTHCFLESGKNLLISKSLINFESILCDLHFARIHNKHLVNLKYVKKYYRGSGGTVKMSDQTELPVSKSRKSNFLEKMAQFAHRL